jgi:hypothetical protein
LEILLRLTHSASAATLAPLWKELAAATKRFEATAITRAIAATALLMGAAVDVAPIVTPSLAAKLHQRAQKLGLDRNYEVEF